MQRRPLIAPATQFLYPQRLAEDAAARQDAAAGALEVLVKPADCPFFLATFARGFADPALPHGVWRCPHPDWLCAAAGGYVYLIDTRNPQRAQQISYRPVIEIRPATEQGLLLFAGFHAVLAWGGENIAWESDKLSDEGLRITRLHDSQLHGFGWDMRSDTEIAFTLDLRTGRAFL